MTAGSKPDLLLAKSQPISDCGRTSVTILKKREKVAVQQQLQSKKGVRICERNYSADVSEGREDCGKDTVHLQPMDVNGGANIQVQLTKDPTSEHEDG